MKRVTFVEKTAGEVGDGTDFPILVTLDQLAEIMYRVRDAWFTAGSLVSSYTLEYDPPVTVVSTTAFLNTPDTELAAAVNIPGGGLFGSTFTYVRAYNTADTVPAAFDSYFNAGYFIFGSMYRDCNTEVGIWYPDYGYSYDDQNITFRSGFSHFVESRAEFGPSPPPEGFYTIFTDLEYSTGYNGSVNTFATVKFTGEVAYVGDNPLDPAAEIYLGVEMNCSMASGGVRTKIDGYHTGDTGANFVLGLAGGDSVSCKLYSGVTHDSISDFVLQAQRWWPYAKGSPPTPVWDSETGAKL
jgi:hypothetical protein